eukprot:Awhi_evm1s454
MQVVFYFCERAICLDGVANGNEQGVDCSHACQKACETYSEGIKNQDEVGVDCGGDLCQQCPVDWVLGAEGQTCEVCTAVGGNCNLAPMHAIDTIFFVASNFLVGINYNVADYKPIYL